MKRKWLVVATALMALVAISCGGGSNQTEPDRVVGVLLKCIRPAAAEPAREYSDDGCRQILSGYGQDLRSQVVSHFNMRYAVTVRTSTGGGYTLEVPATTTVTVGQVWPPAP
jgi:hypothetical protein